MAGVACTLVAGMWPDLRCAVLSGGVEMASMGGSGSEVDICKIKFYICRVIRNPSWDLNQFELPVLRGYRDSIHYRNNVGLVNY